MTLLVALLLLLAAAAGTGVVLSRNPLRQVMALGVNGLVLALLFMALQAPDVAFAELVVGAAAVPLLFLAVLASIRMDREPPAAPVPRIAVGRLALPALLLVAIANIRLIPRPKKTKP